MLLIGLIGSLEIYESRGHNITTDVCAPRRVSSFNFMNIYMSIHVEYLLELSKILPSKVSRGQEAAEMTDDSSMC